MTRVPNDTLERSTKRDLASALARAVSAGIISGDQAAAIERSEAARRAGPRSFPPAAEALAYVGGVLALAAGSLYLSHAWSGLPAGARVGATALATIGLFAGGWVARRSDDSAVSRLAGILWLLSVGTSIALGWVVVRNVLRVDDDAAGTLVGGAATAYAAVLWSIRRRSPQLLAMGAGVLVTTASVLYQTDASAGAAALTIWCVGLGWMAATAAGLLRPTRLSYALGGFAMLVGPWIHEEGWGAVLALVTAVVLMGFGVARRQEPVLYLGAVGLFSAVTDLVIRYFAPSSGAPAALLVCGLALIAIALGTAHVRKAMPTTGDGKGDGEASDGIGGPAGR